MLARACGLLRTSLAGASSESGGCPPVACIGPDRAAVLLPSAGDHRRVLPHVLPGARGEAEEPFRRPDIPDPNQGRHVPEARTAARGGGVGIGDLTPPAPGRSFFLEQGHLAGIFRPVVVGKAERSRLRRGGGGKPAVWKHSRTGWPGVFNLLERVGLCRRGPVGS
jgi:hypothetical protein